MFGLSFTHLLILAVIAIVFIGPEQLPEVARTFARLLNEWKRTTSDIKYNLSKSLEEPPKYVPPEPNPPPAEVPPHLPNDYPGGENKS